jgi:hypothetical protein
VKRSAKVCFDAFGWLAWRQDEPGAANVQRCLDDADRGRAECVTSITNLGEAFYRLVRLKTVRRGGNVVARGAETYPPGVGE